MAAGSSIKYLEAQYNEKPREGWTKLPKSLNEFIENEEFRISYASNEWMKKWLLEETGRLSNDDSSNPETALVVQLEGDDKRKCYILRGDHREAYEKLFPDKQKCIDYFNSKKDTELHFWYS